MTSIQNLSFNIIKLNNHILMYKLLIGLLFGVPLFCGAQIVKWDTPSTTRTTPTSKVEKTEETIYTIQVGTFQHPKLADFQSIQNIGQLYSEESGDQFYEVFLGSYPTVTAAEKVLELVQAKGYSAFVAERPRNLGKEIVVIQLLSTQNAEALQWESIEQIGKLYGLLEDAAILKVVTGPFINRTAAANRIAHFRSKGFKDAFVKTVHSQLLTPINYFEKGLTPTVQTDILADAIDRIADGSTTAETTINPPIDYKTEVPTDNTPARLETPTTPATTSAEVIHSKNVPVPGKTATIPVPAINAKVKRTSALDLQKVLKREQYYQGSLDGYYGQGTGEGYRQFIQQDFQYKKYLLVAPHITTTKEEVVGLQYLINSLTDNDAGLIAALDRSSHPIAKAYLGYWKFINQGPSPAVNQLLNAAIQESFAQAQVKNAPPFDYTANYDYTDLKQLLLHLRYLHAAPTNAQYAIPCWVFEKHRKEANEVYKKAKLATLGELNISGCPQFEDWESINSLQYFLSELQPQQLSPSDQATQEKLTTGRSFLYLFPTALTTSQKKEIDQWKIDFWKRSLAATNNHPLLEKYYGTLEILFFQSQVVIEDYYMQLGFTADQAEGLALTVLKTYVEIPLKVYFR